MQIYHRLVARDERQVGVIFDEDQLSLFPFEEKTRADIDRKHVAHDVPDARQILPVLLPYQLDGADLNSLCSHVLRTNVVQEAHVLFKQPIQQRQERRLYAGVVVLKRIRTIESSHQFPATGPRTASEPSAAPGTSHDSD
jgi:hypothetical protein